MPIFAAAAKNAMLDALPITSVSLHSAYDAAGLNELSGGTPPYARLAVTFAAAALGTKALTGAPYTFDVPAATFAWIGMWSGAGVFQGMTPNGGTILRPFVVDDLVADTLKSDRHGFVVNDTLVVWAGSAGVLPTGLIEGTTYYVVSVIADALQVAATLAGTAIALSGTGNGFGQRITPVTNAAQSTFVLNALTLDATVAA